MGKKSRLKVASVMRSLSSTFIICGDVKAPIVGQVVSSTECELTSPAFRPTNLRYFYARVGRVISIREIDILRVCINNPPPSLFDIVRALEPIFRLKIPQWALTELSVTPMDTVHLICGLASHVLKIIKRHMTKSEPWEAL